jgi:hypothetical protein
VRILADRLQQSATGPAIPLLDLDKGRVDQPCEQTEYVLQNDFAA